MSEAAVSSREDVRPAVVRLRDGWRKRFATEDGTRQLSVMGGKTARVSPSSNASPQGGGEGGSCDALLYRTQLARVQHRERVWQRTREARDEALTAYLRASADLALVREGVLPGFGGDHRLRQARIDAGKSSVAPVVVRDHPIDLMFRRGQLKPEWRCLFEAFQDLQETAEGGSYGVVDFGRPVVQAGGVPQFRTSQLQAVQDIEADFKAPIRAKAGDKALGVFEVTHRPMRTGSDAVMGVKELGADGRYGRRKIVGQLLERAYEALADHHGITAARARARFRRDPDARPEMGIVNPLTPAERAEIEAHEAAVASGARARQAARFQEGKDRAAELQRQRRAGAR